MYYCIAAVHADASLTQVGKRQMSNAADRGGRLCLFVARSALSLALQALNGTPQSETIALIDLTSEKLLNSDHELDFASGYGLSLDSSTTRSRSTSAVSCKSWLRLLRSGNLEAVCPQSRSENATSFKVITDPRHLVHHARRIKCMFLHIYYASDDGILNLKSPQPLVDISTGEHHIAGPLWLGRAGGARLSDARRMALGQDTGKINCSLEIISFSTSGCYAVHYLRSLIAALESSGPALFIRPRGGRYYDLHQKFGRKERRCGLEDAPIGESLFYVGRVTREIETEMTEMPLKTKIEAFVLVIK
ncbi:hypothetical protein EVAR_84442_1 [Eumeta japonica]|uniref:Uncharacterized protein n=1 Tax=Eumeta variegata TaxID=151549 RepID=A0A4C1W1K9_EUMVA|nr:hypothetical protein EVAR_84442_1 [Eumeta japonica]